MSSWGLPQDSLLHLSLISVGLLSQMLFILSLVLIHQDLQEQVKQSQPKIWPRLLQSNVLYSTALIKLITSRWDVYFLDFVNKAAGHVSMSSIESVSRYCLLLLNNFCKSEMLFSKLRSNSLSKVMISISNQNSDVMLP
jgi:hypothetical protein